MFETLKFLFPSTSIIPFGKGCMASFWLLLGGSFSLPFSCMVGSFGALTMVFINLRGGSFSLPSCLNAGSFGALTLASSMSVGSVSLTDHGGEGSFSLSLFFIIQHAATMRPRPVS
jgi:hypothetical protein